MRDHQIIVESGRSRRGLCKFEFGNDLSLYISPFSRKGNYYYGAQVLANGQVEKTFPFTEQVCVPKRPRVSIHETGDVHIRFGRQKVGPLRIPPIITLRGQHIATVTFDYFDRLPVFHGDLKDTFQLTNLRIELKEKALSARLRIYLNGERPHFSANCDHVMPINQPDRPTLYVGLSAVTQSPLGSGISIKRGVTIICGWDPTKPALVEQEFLYLRGE